MKDAMKIKSLEVSCNALEEFLVTLTRDQLVGLVGEMQAVTRSPGYLEQYMSSREVDALLNRIASHCVQDGDIERAVEFFVLGGDWRAAAEQYCAVLSTHLLHITEDTSASGTTLSSAEARRHWQKKATMFVARVNKLAGTGAGQEQSFQEALAFLHALLGLYAFVDKFCIAGESEDALVLLDSLGIVPSTEREAQQMQQRVSHLYRRVLDDLLVLVSSCIQAAYQKVKSSSEIPLNAAQGAAGYRGLTTDRDMKLMRLKERAGALLRYVQGVRGFLSKPQTVSVIAKLDAMLV
jgi:hypothetical protein